MMKKFILSCLVLTLVSSIYCTSAYTQKMNLPGNWKFIRDDNADYKNVHCDDHLWATATLNENDNLDIKNSNTIGWYKLTFELPASLLNKDVVLNLGYIDDADETYCNGVPIGKSGRFPPGEFSAWDKDRAYVIKKEILKKKNTIAVRVYNIGFNGGFRTLGDGALPAEDRMTVISKADVDKKRSELIKSKKSFYQYTISNGLVAAVYNEKTNCIERAYPHIFSFYDSAITVQPILQNLKIVENVKPLSTAYWQNTHIVKVKYSAYTLYYFTSFTQANKIFYIVAQGSKTIVDKIKFKFEKTENATVKQSEKSHSENGQYTKYFAFGFSDTLNPMPDMNDALNKAVSENLLAKEVKFMKHYFINPKIPKSLTPQERNTVEQSISILKMSQVSDKEVLPDSHGQILASLRPGVWSICWVRDGSYSIEAMSRVGMFNEAKKGLEFMLKATPTNQFVHYIFTDGKDYGAQVPYIISLTRYFGNGREECDYNENGPNIELDGLGLFLTAFYHYVKESGDTGFVHQWKTQLDTIANAIIQNINDKGILRRDSGPWEHHLPGREYAWPSGVCARGLQYLSELYKKTGYNNDTIKTASQRLYNGIIKNFVVNGEYLKGNANETNSTAHYWFDAGTFELFADGLITDKKLFTSHIKAYEYLRCMNDTSRGYVRFNSNDSYENQEWPFANLRVAVAQVKFGNRSEAKKMIDRITAYANSNHNFIPEILGNDMSLYKGAIPMVGFGAGAYINAVVSYYGQ